MARISGQTRNIIATYSRASRDELAALTWYRDGMDEVCARVRALRQAGKITHKGRITRRMLAGITAALSPNKSWQMNVKLVCDLLMTGDCGTYKTQVRKALAILHGSEFAQVLKGRKERAFAENLASPDGRSDFVTVDGHAFSVWMGERIMTSKAKVPPYLYETIADAYREAAEILGFGRDEAMRVQAVCWITHRRIYNSKGHIQDQRAKEQSDV